MKNGVYFTVIALLVAELLKFFIYANYVLVTSRRAQNYVK